MCILTGGGSDDPPPSRITASVDADLNEIRCATNSLTQKSQVRTGTDFMSLPLKPLTVDEFLVWERSTSPAKPWLIRDAIHRTLLPEQICDRRIEYGPNLALRLFDPADIPDVQAMA